MQNFEIQNAKSETFLSQYQWSKILDFIVLGSGILKLCQFRKSKDRQFQEKCCRLALQLDGCGFHSWTQCFSHTRVRYCSQFLSYISYKGMFLPFTDFSMFWLGIIWWSLSHGKNIQLSHARTSRTLMQIVIKLLALWYFSALLCLQRVVYSPRMLLQSQSRTQVKHGWYGSSSAFLLTVIEISSRAKLTGTV